MLTIILKGHENYYGLSDIVRLFWEGPKEDRDNRCLTLETGPDITVISELTDDGKVTAYRAEYPLPPVAYDGIPAKRAVKVALYKLLSEFTGEAFPWGALTGIRPTLVAKEEGFNPQGLKYKYMVRSDKAELAAITAKRESQVLSLHDNSSINIYIGVPFCPSRCEYCSFISQDVMHHMDMLKDYKEALVREVRQIAPKLNRKIASVYIGGGTPTVFDDDTFVSLMDEVSNCLPMDSDTEFTVEAGRPDTITATKLKAMKTSGVGRICINPQTFVTDTLTRLNRKHSAEDVIRVYELARDAGICNINMDLIAGLKYEMSDDFLYSVDKLLELRPENITIHTLYKKRRAKMSRGDVLDRGLERGGTDEALSQAYGIVSDAGYIPYYLYRQKDTGHGLENVGFALKGTECYYNVAMMGDERDVLSFGSGGMSKRIMGEGRLERLSCTKDVRDYIARAEGIAAKKLQFFA